MSKLVLAFIIFVTMCVVLTIGSGNLGISFILAFLMFVYCLTLIAFRTDK